MKECAFTQREALRETSLYTLSSLIDNEKPDANEAVSGLIRFESEVEESH